VLVGINFWNENKISLVPLLLGTGRGKFTEGRQDKFMDWKIFFMTFMAVFFAELADKTQLVGINISAKSGRPFSVWLGSVSAYIIVTVFSVLIGAAIAKTLKPELIRVAGGSLFIIMGLLMLLKWL
jgi:putative Ca2+/H+ antiporter (TMEM165/GDT1 family)